MKLHFHFMKLAGTALHQGMAKHRAWPVPPCHDAGGRAGRARHPRDDQP